MAGKAYTMREMRGIVDYLTEHKAYGEIKGRKMWMEFANSKHTVRTWQSLKETFLKRILPDLHNPYYKLSLDQVRSFREGYDVAEREKSNRLEFRTASEDSSANADSQNEDAQPKTIPDDEVTTTAIVIEPSTTSIENELENATGEGVKCAKIPCRSRSSADTVVLEYENAEEVQRVLESPTDDVDEPKTKSLKDMLTFEYAAPLTPLVRELLEDFETESEASDKDPGLSIIEAHPENTQSKQKPENKTPSENDKSNEAVTAIEIENAENAPVILINDGDSSDVIKEPAVAIAQQTPQGDIQGKSDEPQKDKSLKLSKKPEKIQTEDNNNDESIKHENKDDNKQIHDVTDPEPQNNTDSVTALEISPAREIAANAKNQKESITTIDNTTSLTQNTGNTSSDTLLPNNQEALDDSKKALKTGDNAKNVKNNGKRSEKRTSRDSRESKKQKTSDDKSNITNVDEGSTPVEIVDIDSETQNTNHENTAITPNMEVIEIFTDTPILNDTEEQFNDHLPSINITKPNKIQNDISDKDENNIEEVNEKPVEKDEDTNPCLLSVSLFDEQFRHTKYSDSDSDDEATPAPKVTQAKDKPPADSNQTKEMEDKLQQEVQSEKEMEVISIKDSEKAERSVESSECQKRRQSVILNKQIQNKAATLQKERALANVFGFSHGAVASNSRKRQLSHRRRSHHRHRRHSKNMSSNSSEWTSESDSDSFVSPPRGRKNRQTRKYLKPKSSRILQDPNEGMLYVIFGKNIYPLVKDGKHIKNFLTYPDSGSDVDEESYWRQKYVDERKRVDEYKKLMKETRKNRVSPQINKPSSPILPSTTPRKSLNAHSSLRSVQNENGKESPVVEHKTEPKDVKMVLKIASKNGLECCLEGGWSQISNAMPQMVRMMQNEEPSNNGTHKPAQSNNMEVENPTSKIEAMELSSGAATPAIDLEVHEKVDKIETEIFKEIERREQEEEDVETDIENVTKRKRGRPKKDSRASSTDTLRSPKSARVSKTSSTESKQPATKPKNTRNSKQKLEVPAEIQDKEPEIEKPTSRTKTKTKTAEKKTKQTETKTQQTETLTKQTDTKTQQTETLIKQSETKAQKQTKPAEKQNDSTEKKKPKRRESLRLSKQKDAREENKGIESSDVSPVGLRSSARLVKTPKKYDTDSSASDIQLRSTKSASRGPMDLQGSNHDEALFMFPPSPKNNKISPRGKRNRSMPVINITSPKEITEGKSIDSTQDYQDSDVSLTDYGVQMKKRKVSLVARRKCKNRRVSRRSSYPTLLQEMSSDSNNSSYFVPMQRSQSTINSEVYTSDSYRLLLPKKKPMNVLEPIDEANPIEPQFNLNIKLFNSVSKDSNDNSNIVEISTSSNISLPLSPELSVVEKMSISREMIKDKDHPTINEMQSNASSHGMDFSEYMIPNLDVSVPLMNQQCDLLNKQKDPPKNNATKFTTLSDPMFNKVCRVRLENLTLSESLNQKLHDLLLESNKKKTRSNYRKLNTMKVGQAETAKVNESDPYNTKENVMEVDEIITAKKTKAKKRSSTPRKKITAPKPKVSIESVIEEEHRESCSFGGRKSCPPAVSFIPIDENANNSSDITLNTAKAKNKRKKDVIKIKLQRPNSREKTREKSVGTVSSYTDSGINESASVFLKASDESVDLIHNHSETCLLANECMGDSLELVENTRSIVSINSSLESVDSELRRLLEDTASTSRASEMKISEEFFQTPEGEYHKPDAINSSLLTEDLSDEPPSQVTNWYLLSEDDTATLPGLEAHSYGANLKQLFPIACAVPDLSTISEISKENEDSRKPNFDTDGDTRNCDTQSQF